MSTYMHTHLTSQKKKIESQLSNKKESSRDACKRRDKSSSKHHRREENITVAWVADGKRSVYESTVKEIFYSWTAVSHSPATMNLPKITKWCICRGGVDGQTKPRSFFKCWGEKWSAGVKLSSREPA